MFSMRYHEFIHDIRALIAQEIGKRYPETGLDYANYVMKKANKIELLNSKQILIVTNKNELAGFTVITPKDDNSIKFGPTIVKSTYRGSGLAMQLRKMGEQYFINKGFTRAYSTCRADNKPANRYVQKLGYSKVAALPNQYEIGVTELVYSKELRPWITSLDNELPVLSSRNIVRKRGGALKVCLGFGDFETLAKTIEFAKSTNQIHRAFFFSKYDVENDKKLRRLGFELNSLENLGLVLYGQNFE